jgi:ATP-binding cassette, subfamily C, bacterial
MTFADIRSLSAYLVDKHRRRTVVVIVLGLLSAAASGVSFLSLLPVLRRSEQPVRSDAIWPIGRSLVAALVAFVVLVTLSAFVDRAVDLQRTLLRRALIDDLRLGALSAVNAADWSHTSRVLSSDVQATIVADGARAGMAVEQLSIVVVESLVIVGLVTVSLKTSLWALPIVAAAAAASALPIVVAIRRSHRVGAKYAQAIREFSGAAGEMMNTAHLARAHGTQSRALVAIQSSGQLVDELAVDQVRQAAAARAIAQITFGLGLAVIAGVGLQVLDLPVQRIVFVAALLGRLGSSTLRLVRAAQAGAAVLPAFEAIRTLRRDAERHHEDLASIDTSSELVFHRDIVFEQVTYAYPDADPVLHAVSFRMRHGESAAVFGASGSGKSTLADLLTGVLRPTDGSILIDGVALDASTLRAWRHRVGYVTQDAVIVAGSVRDNLTLLTTDPIGDGELWTALRIVSAEGFVRGLTNGLDHVVGDRGTGLSGGQRQRLAIARALVRKPEFLVLDEATNALDIETEAAVLASIRTALPDATIVAIAHRQYAVGNADVVFTIANDGITTDHNGR